MFLPLSSGAVSLRRSIAWRRNAPDLAGGDAAVDRGAAGEDRAGKAAVSNEGRAAGGRGATRIAVGGEFVRARIAALRSHAKAYEPASEYFLRDGLNGADE